MRLGSCSGIACLVLWTLVTFAGCNSDDSHGRVSGTITLDGQPLVNAMVEFVPVGEGGTSYGRTDQNGKYSMEFARDQVGASVGENEVRITTSDMTVDENENMVRIKEQVPVRYNLETELRCSVKPGSNTADFKLLGEGPVGDTLGEQGED